jgi:hypothetical protein
VDGNDAKVSDEIDLGQYYRDIAIPGDDESSGSVGGIPTVLFL